MQKAIEERLRRIERAADFVSASTALIVNVPAHVTEAERDSAVRSAVAADGVRQPVIVISRWGFLSLG